MSPNTDRLTKGSSTLRVDDGPKKAAFFTLQHFAILGASLSRSSRNLPVSFDMSVRSYVAFNNSRAPEIISIKSDIGEF